MSHVPERNEFLGQLDRGCVRRSLLLEAILRPSAEAGLTALLEGLPHTQADDLMEQVEQGAPLAAPKAEPDARLGVDVQPLALAGAERAGQAYIGSILHNVGHQTEVAEKVQ